MKVVTIHLPEAYIELLDQLVAKKKYSSKGEAIRAAVRDLIYQEFGSLVPEKDEKSEDSG